MTRITDTRGDSKLKALCGSSSSHLQGAAAYCADPTKGRTACTGFDLKSFFLRDNCYYYFHR